MAMLMGLRRACLSTAESTEAVHASKLLKFPA
jgi:hypothetical protein